jgi:hypothetical protein
MMGNAHKLSYTVDEFAKATGLCRSLVYKALADKKLRGVKFEAELAQRAGRK